MKPPRTKYPNSVKSPSQVPLLKPGEYNKKLGGLVTKGPLKGAKVLSLSLQERATCPIDCAMWEICYGDNMPFAHRIDHASPEFQLKLAEELQAACGTYNQVLVRLHVLGDFFDPDYVRFWDDALSTFPNLNAFGYTAWKPETPVGKTILKVISKRPWHRFAIRYSDLPQGTHAALVAGRHDAVDSFWCPEQEGKTKSCATCAACWDGVKTVRFRVH